MSRLLLAAAALALLPAASSADPRPPAQPGQIPAGLFDRGGPAGCPNCGTGGGAGYGGWGTAQSPVNPGGPSPFGARLQQQLWWDEHNCAPDGCPKPIGCGNFWTEFKYVFGSCRQFFGTSQSTNGHFRGTVERAK